MYINAKFHHNFDACTYMNKVYKRDLDFDVTNCPFEEKTQANL